MRIYALIRKQNAPMFWGAVVGAGASLVGSLLANKTAKETAGAGLLSLDDQKALFDYQQARLEAQQNSAHQREVADLRAAGLNPILSANGGNGASSGIAAPIDGASYNAARAAANGQLIQGKLGVLNAIVQSAGQIMNFENQYENSQANVTKAEADATNAKTAADRLEFEKEKYRTSELEKDLSSIGLNRAQTTEIIQKLPYIKNLLKAQEAFQLSSANAVTERLPVEIWKMKQDATNNPTKAIMDILRPILDDLKKSGQNAAEKKMFDAIQRAFAQ